MDELANATIIPQRVEVVTAARQGRSEIDAASAKSSAVVGHSIWRHGFWLSISSFAQAGLGLAQTLIVARFYGPGPLLDALGACNGLIRYLSDLIGGLTRAFLQNYVLFGGEGSRAERLFWGCQSALFGLLGAFTFCSWIFHDALLAWIYPSMGQESRQAAGSLLPLLLLALTFTVGLQISNGKAVARKQAPVVAASQFAIASVTIATTILFLPVVGLVGVLAVKAGAIFVASVWLLNYFKDRPEVSWASLRELALVARDGAWLVVLGGLSGGIILLENWFASAMPEGRLTTISWARQFAFMVGMLLQGGMRQVVSAHFQELVRDKKRDELLVSVRKITEYSVVMGALVALGTFFLGEAALQILFGGSAWEPEAIHRLWEVCSVYSLVVLAACLGGLLVPVLIATKSFRWFLLVELVRVSSFASCAWLLRGRDLAGLAAAQVMQQFLGTGVVVVLVCCYLRCKPSASDLKLLFRLAAAIAPTAACLWLGQMAANLLKPELAGVAAAWCNLAVTVFVALPGFAVTLWLGACWGIAPTEQVTRAARRLLLRR